MLPMLCVMLRSGWTEGEGDIVMCWLLCGICIVRVGHDGEVALMDCGTSVCAGDCVLLSRCWCVCVLGSRDLLSVMC